MGVVWILGAWLWGLSFLDTPSHALYLGLVEISHEQGNIASDLQVKVFYDDLQSGIRAAYPDKFQPANPELWAGKNKSLVQAYFQKHLSLWVNRQPVTFQLRSVSWQQDTYFLHFQLDCPPKWGVLQVKADFLMELFPDQTNVVQAANGAQKRFGRTTASNPSLEFPF